MSLQKQQTWKYSAMAEFTIRMVWIRCISFKDIIQEAVIFELQALATIQGWGFISDDRTQLFLAFGIWNFHKGTSSKCNVIDRPIVNLK